MWHIFTFGGETGGGISEAEDGHSVDLQQRQWILIGFPTASMFHKDLGEEDDNITELQLQQGDVFQGRTRSANCCFIKHRRKIL